MRGYSIIEISIALIVLALIFAGIATASSFIEQSLLRSVISDVNRFHASIDGFKDAYSYYPGDYPNAYRRWGAGSPTCTNSSGFATSCNGDGDGKIEFASGNNAPVEDLLVWRHLTASGFLMGIYSGTTNGGSARFAEGINSPKSGFESATYSFHDLISTQYGFLGKVTHYGTVGAGTENIPSYGSVSASEAYYIDSTIDDGKASSGNVIALRANDVGSGCVDNPLASSPTYDFSTNNKACRLIFFYEKK